MKMVVYDNTIDSVIFDSYNGCNGLIMVAIAYSSCFFGSIFRQDSFRCLFNKS